MELGSRALFILCNLILEQPRLRSYVEGDKDTNTIVFTVSKDVIGTDVASYRYVVVSGSQDGFGTGKWRDVDETAKTWTLGGGSDASTNDGIDTIQTSLTSLELMTNKRQF